jgi:hypothetical protein
LILSLISQDANIPLKFKKAIAYFIRVEPDDLTVDALLALCRLNDAPSAKEAALTLLKTWDRLSPSNKKRIIHTLLKWFPEDTGILKETLTKVVDFYRDPRYGFDLLDELNAHASPLALERFSKLSKDPTILSLRDLYQLRAQNMENSRLQHFLDELITEIQNQPPPF